MADVDPLMHRSSEKQNVFLWIAFSVGKSTALVVPILPLFFFQERGYSIAYMLSVASFYVLLPVVLDVPMALLGDRFGHKRMLVSGSLFFTMAFLAVAIDLPHAYHLYLKGRYFLSRRGPADIQRAIEHFEKAIAADPALLVLDEATSALDEKLEGEIYRMLKAELPATTIVSIGHRSTLVELHDERIEMQPGADGVFVPAFVTAKAAG